MTKYSEKLKDPRWQKKRLGIMQRDGWRCLVCNSDTSPLTVHHYKYLRHREPWEYPDELLATVCDNCHQWLGMIAKLSSVPRLCRNCCHYQEIRRCTCRDKDDVITKPNKCIDWYPKESIEPKEEQPKLV